MKYLAIVQARCGSTRLPNKVLKDLCGEPSLQRELERIQRSKYIDETIVVTSISKNNIPIIQLCSNLGLRIGVGSEDDVLDRYYQIAKLLKPEYVIRLTADCPCFDACLLDDAIEKLDADADYCAPISETIANGLDFEIIKYNALEKAWKEADFLSEREHVTLYIKNHTESFKLQDYVSPIGYFGEERWTVDENEDYEVVRLIYEHFFSENKEDFNYLEILEFLNNNPEIKEKNKKYKRNEGLIKSLANDRCVTHSS